MATTIEITKYEKKMKNKIEGAFITHEQEIISDLFREACSTNTFPLTSVDCDAFAKRFWEKYLSDIIKIKVINEKISKNCIEVEGTQFIVRIWIKKQSTNVAKVEEGLLEIADYMCNYSTKTTIRIKTRKWKAKGDLYISDKPVLNYIIEFAEDNDGFFSAIRLVSVPHGELLSHYKRGKILSSISTHSADSIYFDYKAIISCDKDNGWRYRLLYVRRTQFSSIQEVEEIKEVEKAEIKYLYKYYHFLKFNEDEMLKGFQTKEEIKSDWEGLYGTEISDFAVGAERIVYALLNGKGIGQPNSAPVGADLFFEVDDAFIHIDLKTVQLNNIGDFNSKIFVGLNQNSYKGKMIVEKNKGKKQSIREYDPSLPYHYSKGHKLCLSYFISILYDKDSLDIFLISLLCMPNGLLEKVYGSMVLNAGKNIDKTRYNFVCSDRFLTDENIKRVKCIVRDDHKIDSYKSKNYPNGIANRLKYYTEQELE